MLLEAKDGFFKELDIEFVNQEAIVTSFKKMIQESVNGISFFTDSIHHLNYGHINKKLYFDFLYHFSCLRSK